MATKLVVNTGGMFGGKSTELQRQGKRHILAGHRVVFLKPKMDDRYSTDAIVTHEGESVKAINIEDSILENRTVIEADVILVDEVQFFNRNIIGDIDLLLRLGKTVYVSGLDMDFAGRGFPIVETLMAMADEVHKFKAVCERCGADGTFTAKRTDNKSLVELGSRETYIPLCRRCYYKDQGGVCGVE